MSFSMWELIMFAHGVRCPLCVCKMAFSSTLNCRSCGVKKICIYFLLDDTCAPVCRLAELNLKTTFAKLGTQQFSAGPLSSQALSRWKETPWLWVVFPLTPSRGSHWDSSFWDHGKQGWGSGSSYDIKQSSGNRRKISNSLMIQGHLGFSGISWILPWKIFWVFCFVF